MEINMRVAWKVYVLSIDKLVPMAIHYPLYTIWTGRGGGIFARLILEHFSWKNKNDKNVVNPFD